MSNKESKNYTSSGRIPKCTKHDCLMIVTRINVAWAGFVDFKCPLCSQEKHVYIESNKDPESYMLRLYNRLVKRANAIKTIALESPLCITENLNTQNAEE